VRPGRAAGHSLPSSAAVMEEKSYTCTHHLGHTGPVTGSLYLYLLHGTNISKELVASVLRYGRLFYTEDGSSRNVFRIVDSCLPNYTASRLKEFNLHNEHRQNDGFRMLV